MIPLAKGKKGGYGKSSGGGMSGASTATGTFTPGVEAMPTPIGKSNVAPRGKGGKAPAVKNPNEGAQRWK